MKIRTITVPRGIQYLSQVEEIKNDYCGGLPKNAIINKQVTGCGGTSIALSNSEYYIVAVHLVEMIKCKVDQKDRYPNVLGVYSETTDEEIIQYLKNGGKKIMVTYDSVPRLKRVIGLRACKSFNLLVDEFHKLISYLGHFKQGVGVKLLEHNDDFKSVSYLTATPTNYKYLPQPMKDLDIVEFDWEAKVNPNIKHAFVKEGLTNRVLYTILDLYDNTDKEICVYYNSRVAVASLIKNLILCKPDLTLSDFNIMFANTPSNTKYFKKFLKGFEYGKAHDGITNKRISFISSMGFEGLDFYPNQITKATPISIVVSDPRLKSMQYDINIELVQILGRFRANKETNEFVDNEMIYLWNTQNSDYQLTEEEYLSKVTEEKNKTIDHMKVVEVNDRTKKITVQALENGTDEYIILEDGSKDPYLHPYSVEAQMSAYNAVHSQSSVLGNLDSDGNLKEDSNVVVNLANLDPDVSTFEIPEISTIYAKSLGRNPSVKKMINEYNNLNIDLYDCIYGTSQYYKVKDKLENFLQENTIFNEWIASGVTTENMTSLGCNREKINNLALNLRIINDKVEKITEMLNFKIDDVYTKEYIIEQVTNIYNKLNISTEKIKATEIKKWYEIKANTLRINGKPKSGYKIISKL